MVKVLIYGYATGVFTSRKIARKLHEDVTFSVLGAALSQASRDRRFSRQSFAGTRGVVPRIERRADRLAAIQAVCERLEARQREAAQARGRNPGDERILQDG